MRLGIFAKTFARPRLEEVFDAVRVHHLDCVQFNLAFAGLPTLPDEITPSLVTCIREAAISPSIEIVAVSGMYNMIHPDSKVRQAGLCRLQMLTRACQSIGTSVITLRTGPHDPENMWCWHPENASAQA